MGEAGRWTPWFIAGEGTVGGDVVHVAVHEQTGGRASVLHTWHSLYMTDLNLSVLTVRQLYQLYALDSLFVRLCHRRTPRPLHTCKGSLLGSDIAALMGRFQSHESYNGDGNYDTTYYFSAEPYFLQLDYTELYISVVPSLREQCPRIGIRGTLQYLRGMVHVSDMRKVYLFQDACKSERTISGRGLVFS